ncbi:amino acid adenylation domain-containing protein [Pseudomonas syringae]|uniref:amino acid adenylation domain-containing protein n=1 Tax=Pseudomonas syringae TaxID=317 RepID=UPI0039659CCF
MNSLIDNLCTQGQELLPLASVQQGIWLDQLAYPHLPYYNIGMTLEIKGDIDIALFEKAIQRVIDSHDALRLSFSHERGMGGQRVLSKAPFKLEVTDFPEVDGDTEQAIAHLRESFRQPFESMTGQLWESRLVRCGPQLHYWFNRLHHLVADGIGAVLIAHAVSDAYSGLLEGKETLAEGPSYLSFLEEDRAYMASSRYERDRLFWEQSYAQLPPVLLQRRADFKAGLTNVPAPSDQVQAMLPRALYNALTQFASECNLSVAHVLVGVISTYFCRTVGVDEIVVGMPVHNRTNARQKATIGMFSSVSPIRVGFDPHETLVDLMNNIGTQLRRTYRHQRFPIAELNRSLRLAQNGRHQLFDVSLSFESFDGDVTFGSEDPARVLMLDNGYEQTPMAIFVRDYHPSEDIHLDFNFNTAYFTFEEAQRVQQRIFAMLEAVLNQHDTPLAHFPLMSTSEHQQLATFNDTAHPYPRDVLIHQLIEQQAAQRPDACAVRGDSGPLLTYAELNQQANQLAHRLIELGVEPDTRVAVSLRRGAEMVVALLGILKAGGAYVPIDPDLPSARQAYMLEDSSPQAVLTTRDLSDNLPASDLPVLVLDGHDDRAQLARQQSVNPDAKALGLQPNHLAYVLYTSGSTGRPKGVAHSRAALDNLIAWQLEQTPVSQRVLQFASLNFDVSFQEICSTLCQGGSLVLMSEAGRKDLAALRPTLVAEGVQRAFLPFAVLQQLASFTETDASVPMPLPKGGCEVITAGEALLVNDELRAFVCGLGGAQLHNQYGPTETHVVSQFSLNCDDAGQWPDAPPIGRPIANARLYVLDGDLNPVPVGVAGELYIAGACLARGYLNRPDLSAERFLPDPFNPQSGARMYRSGDLARFAADGNVHYLGRIDQQVKLRGFRVELGEIDSLLHQQPGVREAVVLLREDVPGDKRLVAYVVGPATAETLRAELHRHLPEHMVPTAWVALAQLPLTRNGKLDRQALPVPERQAASAYVAPRDETERQMVRIWAEVLKCPQVGIHDNFFELGGHSLLATRMIYMINQRMGAQLSLSSLFKTPVLMDLAEQVRLGRGDGPSLDTPFAPIEADRSARYAPFPLTDIQQAYWFGREASVSLGGVSAHGYEELRIPGLDVPRFEQALNRMILRHDMLRVVFLGDGTQQVLDSVPTYHMPRNDLRGLSADAAQQALQGTRERQSHQVLDASRWPLFEFSLSLLDGDISHLHISLDALIVDAASTQILARELMAFYADPQLQLPEPGLTFRDYVLAEQRLRNDSRYAQALDYWREKVATLAPAPDLPLVCQPESISQPHFTRRDRELSALQWSRLKELARQFAVTPSVMLLTAFSEVLALWSRQPRFTLSLPLFNRMPLHPDVDEIIGDFTSLVLLEVNLDGAASFIDKARAVQARLWQDIDHSVVSGVRVLRELSQARGVQQTAMPIVFNSTLSEAAPELAEFNLADALNAEHMHSITQTPQVWLDHTLLELEGRLLFNWDSIDELFPQGLIEQMFVAYNALLDRLLQADAWNAGTVDLIPLARLPVPEASPADSALMHELFDRQALAAPDALAVIGTQRQLSYRQLRAEARQLAALLQRRGVVPNQLVAVVMERGWEQVVATLAIQYAGGAYLPLDPALPVERLEHILQRAEASLALTQPALLQRVEWPAQVQVISVSDPIIADAGRSDQAELNAVHLTPDDLAYVIYTSGSTGLPKGVVIDHRGAVNTLLDINRRFAVGAADRVLAVSSLSFDLSVYDFFGTLAAGAAVVLLEPQQALDPAHWLTLIERHQVSLWNSVPALFGMLLEYVQSERSVLPTCLRVAMLSGDWIPLTLPERAWALQPALQLVSLGGATEASIWSIQYPLQQVDPAWRSIPYGKALDHQRFYVLDDALQVRPTWVAGQLYIGGIGLAKGYWRDEALSAGSFFAHPLTGERLYRTGDLGRWLPDGNIEFLGREDTQVKVQGHRIELGEIEAALNRHPGVQSAVVRVLGEALGEKRLAGYVLKADPSLQASDFTQYLADKLPAYMVPTSFTFVQEWPLSANGKVDKKRLPEPSQVQDAGPALEVQGPQEQQLVMIVQGVLKRPSIAADANLLNLGATSIDIVRISNALSGELQFRPNVAQLLAQPTLLNLLGMYRRNLVNGSVVDSVRQRAGSPEQVIEDPQQRARFKAEQRGRRTFAPQVAALDLARPDNPAFARRFSDYRSVRQFADRPIPSEAFVGLLASLAQGQLHGEVKYQFPSAGGLYPIQCYLYVKPQRVTGVAAGAYYYDPVEHRLLMLDSEPLDPDTYDYFVNRPVYENAAFSLFFIADMAAIRPLYGERSRDFCHIEAGGMAQLLSMTAVEQGLGLCGMGSLEEQQLSALFDLGPNHQLIYSMVGGLRNADEQRRAQVEAFASAADQTDDASDMEEIEI